MAASKITLKNYGCKYCAFRSTQRKTIRRHAREAHGMRGCAGHSNRGSKESDISTSYTHAEYETEVKKCY